MDEQQNIVIIDDNEGALNSLKLMIKKSFPSYEVHCFDAVNDDFFDFITSHDVCLYIIDVVLEDQILDGRELALEILKRQTDPIFLFTSGYDYNLSSFCPLKGKAIYDFLNKPISFEEIKNRVSVLLNVSKTYADLQENMRTVKHAVWDILNYSNLFVIMMDTDFKIKLASWYLATALGFDNEEDLIGKDFTEFIPDKNKDFVKSLYEAITTNDEKYYKPVEIITKVKLHDKVIEVKWFSAFINDTNNMIFNIGIPLEESKFGTTEESIRSYYKDILIQDRTMIESLRDTVLKVSCK